MKMEKSWTTTKLMATGSLTVLWLLFQIILIKGIFLSTGSIFGASSSLIVSPFLTVFVALLIQRFGAAFIFRLLCVLLALPLPSIIPKPINLAMEPLRGLLVDVLFLTLGRRRKIFSFLGGAIDNFVLSLELIILYFSIGLPGTQNIPDFLVTPTGIAVCVLVLTFIGGVSGLGALQIFDRLSSTNVVKRIKGP